MTTLKIWANEAFYEDGITPTKVAVSDALAAKGHRPNTANCSAEEENYYLNQLTTQVNALIVKTNNSGYSILQIANTPESNPINQTVPATGPTTPTVLTHSAFATVNPLAVDDVIDVSYGPIDFINLNTSGSTAFLQLQVSQNGGAFTTIRSYILSTNRAYPLTIRAQFKCTVAGGFSMQLAVLNDNSADVVCRSLEDGTLTLFDYTVMRVMAAIT